MKYAFVPILALASLALFTRCTESESASRFKVISYKGVCSGYYIQDSGEVHYFDVTAAEDGSTSYCSYSKDLDNPSSVTVCVNADGDDAPSSVTIYIYEDDAIAEKETFSRESSSYWDNSLGAYVYTYTLSGSLTHDFSTDDSSSE